MQIPLIQFNVQDEGQPEGLYSEAVSGLTKEEVTALREAQLKWAKRAVSDRLKVISRARQAIAGDASRFAVAATSSSSPRPAAETLAAQVLPLIEACRYLERNAKRVLASRRVGLCRRPLWLAGLRSVVQREPFGIVLVMAPSNYPLFLPGVGLMQALVAGNAVLLKPGEGGMPPARALAEVLERSGLDPRLLRVLSEHPASARAALSTGVDKVVLIGSAATGESIRRTLGLVPATLELSGCDAVFVRSDADLGLVENGLLFGLRLNGGATCIAPRRIFVHASVATELEGRLASALCCEKPQLLAARTSEQLLPLLRDALSRGAHFVHGELTLRGAAAGPIVLAGASADMRLLREDVFAPVLSLVTVHSDEQALGLSQQCPFALGATVFSRDLFAASALADRIDAGVVVINDMIVPTADPRLPFGGRRRSGFGVMRGPEGLLEMTRLKVVCTRRGGQRPHLKPSLPDDADLFQMYLRFMHGRGWRSRALALWRGAPLLARRLWSARVVGPHSRPIS